MHATDCAVRLVSFAVRVVVIAFLVGAADGSTAVDTVAVALVGFVGVSERGTVIAGQAVAGVAAAADGGSADGLAHEPAVDVVAVAGVELVAKVPLALAHVLGVGCTVVGRIHGGLRQRLGGAAAVTALVLVAVSAVAVDAGNITVRRKRRVHDRGRLGGGLSGNRLASDGRLSAFHQAALVRRGKRRGRDLLVVICVIVVVIAVVAVDTTGCGRGGHVQAFNACAL